MRTASFAGLLAASLVAGSVAVPAGPVRAGCSEERVVQIAMAAGRSCWVYRGTATVFVGDFAAGQRITAKMRGEASDYDDKTGRTSTHMDDRVPDVTGPRDFSDGGADGVMAFNAPHDGIYRFSFSPCAMWGGNGIVEICAR